MLIILLTFTVYLLLLHRGKMQLLRVVEAPGELRTLPYQDMFRVEGCQVVLPMSGLAVIDLWERAPQEEEEEEEQEGKGEKHVQGR